MSKKLLLAAAIFALGGPLFNPADKPTEAQLETIKGNLESGNRDSAEKFIADNSLPVVHFPSEWHDPLESGAGVRLASWVKENPEGLTRLIEAINSKASLQDFLEAQKVPEVDAPSSSQKAALTDAQSDEDFKMPDNSIIVSTSDRISRFSGCYVVLDSSEDVPPEIRDQPVVVERTLSVLQWLKQGNLKEWKQEDYLQWRSEQAQKAAEKQA